MRILIDQDGVLADFEQAFYDIWQNSEYAKEFHAISLDNRNSFFLDYQYPEKYRDIIYQIISAKGFFENLPPVEGAIQAINDILADGNEVFICTSPLTPWKNCVSEKYAWVEKHLGDEWVNRIILTKDKTLVDGHILIDDKPEITGCMSPAWQHILYDRPYNKEQNKPRLTWKNWHSVITEYKK